MTYGVRDLVLLNHDMHPSVEDADIKRFKQEVADLLGLPITFASRNNASQDQFDVCVESEAFKVGSGTEICTSRLKTEPFMRWLRENANPASSIIYYGFDANEPHRIQRRAGIMGAQGWKTDYPLIWKRRHLFDTEEFGIQRPLTYSVFNHGNCTGCLKAGWQHWYVVFCTRPDIWQKAKWAEDEIGYSIHSDAYLSEMEVRFSAMRDAGIQPTEKIPHQKFWSDVRKVIPIAQYQPQQLPCECTT